jgi:hypothetical protein
MAADDSVNRPQNARPTDTAAQLRAKGEALQNRMKSAAEVAEAKAKSAIANARLTAAEGKGELQKRVDQARSDAPARSDAQARSDPRPPSEADR